MPIRRHSVVLNHWQFSIRQLRQPLQPPQIFCPYFTLTSKLNLDKSSDFFAAKLLQSSPATDDDHQRLIHWHRLRLLIGGKVAAAEASPVAEVWSLVRALFKVNRKSAGNSERWMTTATGQQSFRGTFTRTFTSNLSVCVRVCDPGRQSNVWKSKTGNWFAEGIATNHCVVCAILVSLSTMFFHPVLSLVHLVTTTHTLSLLLLITGQFCDSLCFLFSQLNEIEKMVVISSVKRLIVGTAKEDDGWSSIAIKLKKKKMKESEREF